MATDSPSSAGATTIATGAAATFTSSISAPADAATAPVGAANAVPDGDPDPAKKALIQGSLDHLVPTKAADLPPPPFKGLLALLYMVKFDPRYNYAFHIDPRGVCKLFGFTAEAADPTVFNAIADINSKVGNPNRAQRFRELISTADAPLGLLGIFVNEIVFDQPDPPPFW
jgi:hypothetical protein